MKERPILFSGEMVRALLAGRKTQTRRIVKGAWHEPAGYLQSEPTGDDGEWYFACAKVPASFIAHCPYGAPGDWLWVKETHHVNHTGEVVHYRADYPGDGDPFNADECGEDHALEGEKWRPSIFCARKHSRLTLEVVSVRVERLQDISQADALAEGVEPVQYGCGGFNCPVGEYRELWNEINGPGSWQLNPWVWVIEFKLIGGAK